MRQLLSFGQYFFEDNTSNFTDNFRDTITRTVRLPYADGGFDQLGKRRAPLAIGKVQIGYWLFSRTGAEMLHKKDVIKGLVNFGVQQLVMQPEDELEPVRFAWARVSHMNANEDADKRGDLGQFINIFFHCPDPHWYNADNDASYWGSGSPVWGDGINYWGGQVATQVYAGPSQTMTSIVNDGNADTTARIRLITTTGQSITNPVITITGPNLNSYVLTYNGTISNGQVLDINGRAASVKLTEADGSLSDAYNNLDLSDYAFMVIPPGASTVSIVSDSASDAGSVRTTWMSAYT